MNKFTAGIAIAAAMLCSSACLSEPVSAAPVSENSQLLAQLPSPVQQVKGIADFKKMCGFAITPIAGTQVIKYLVVNCYIAEIVFNSNGKEINYRATKSEKESLIDSRRMTQLSQPAKALRLTTASGTPVQATLSRYTCKANAVSWTYNGVRYVMLDQQGTMPVADLIKLAKSAAGKDLR